MRKLFEAYRKQDRKKFIEEFEKRQNSRKPKGEGLLPIQTLPNEKLEKILEAEDAERALATNEMLKPTSIPKSLKKQWELEDRERVMRE